MSVALALAAVTARVPLFIGQDVASVAAYRAERCLPAADGVTTYVNFYDLLSPERRFGGAGIDAAGRPAGAASWGAGELDAWASGHLPGIRWLAMGLDITEARNPGGLRAIAAGEHDAEIAQLARLIRALPVTVALRIGYEFDGAWNAGYGDRVAYKAAFRHVVERLRGAGVTNVRFVWQGSAAPVDDVIEGGRRERIGDWWPGDDAVDWVGLSWFVPPDERPTSPAARAAHPPLARALAEELATFAAAHGKSLMIAESAPQGFDLARGVRRAQSPLWDGPPGTLRATLSPAAIWRDWYAPFFAFIRAHADRIAGVAYIDANWDAQPMWGAPYASGYWGDSRVQVNPGIARRWRAALAAAPFGKRVPEGC